MCMQCYILEDDTRQNLRRGRAVENNTVPWRLEELYEEGVQIAQSRGKWHPNMFFQTAWYIEYITGHRSTPVTTAVTPPKRNRRVTSPVHAGHQDSAGDPPKAASMVGQIRLFSHAPHAPHASSSRGNKHVKKRPRQRQAARSPPTLNARPVQARPACGQLNHSKLSRPTAKGSRQSLHFLGGKNDEHQMGRHARPSRLQPVNTSASIVFTLAARVVRALGGARPLSKHANLKLAMPYS
ncbi:hypothetical protein BKA93DRAFT_753108 [Sparassis latifolia]